MPFANNLKTLRLKAGYSQNKLSMLSQVPASKISEYETGKTKFPRVDTAKALATALKCSVDDLINDPEKSSKVNDQQGNYLKPLQRITKAIQHYPELHSQLANILESWHQTGKMIEEVELHEKCLDIPYEKRLALINLLKSE